MSDLITKHCQACEGGAKPLTTEALNDYLSQVTGWQLTEASDSIYKTYQFKNFHETMGFVNAIAWIANQEDHHPNLDVNYKDCTVSWFTHSVDGLTENDFICAAKTDNLLTSPS